VYRDGKDPLHTGDRLTNGWSGQGAPADGARRPRGTNMDAHNGEGGRMERILVAIDFSEPSLAALRCAMALTHAVSGEGLLLHVLEEEPVRRYIVGRQPDLRSAVGKREHAPGTGQ
jgi:Universal stress protein family